MPGDCCKPLLLAAIRLFCRIERKWNETTASVDNSHLCRFSVAEDFWKAKQPGQWSEDEVVKILTKSPWAKKVTPAMPLNLSSGSVNMASGGGGMGGGGVSGGGEGDSGTSGGGGGGRGGGRGMGGTALPARKPSRLRYAGKVRFRYASPTQGSNSRRRGDCPWSQSFTSSRSPDCLIVPEGAAPPLRGSPLPARRVSRSKTTQGRGPAGRHEP